MNSVASAASGRLRMKRSFSPNCIGCSTTAQCGFPRSFHHAVAEDRQAQIGGRFRRVVSAFDAALLDSARDESVAFFSEILDKNLSVLNFVDSDFAMLNGRIALHYGIAGITGNEFRRVALPPNSHRGGVLTQASVLIATSNGMVTSPVRRGAFVMERLLGVGPGTPPPNVPALDKIPPAKDDGTLFTPLERLAMHRENRSCARCHDKIDPLGAGLENFNAIGVWNDKLALRPLVGPPMNPQRNRTEPPHWVMRDADVHGTLLDGTPYNGPEELKQRLMDRKDRFVRSLAENLTIYALGEGWSFPTVRRWTVFAAHGGGSIQAIDSCGTNCSKRVVQR